LFLLIEKIGQEAFLHVLIIKYYFCFHVIALSVNEGLTVIDNVHIKRALGQKAKAGRKSKANSALQKQ
jgi:hypothetical protein